MSEAVLKLLSEMSKLDELEHFGKLGMHWGKHGASKASTTVSNTHKISKEEAADQKHGAVLIGRTAQKVEPARQQIVRTLAKKYKGTDVSTNPETSKKYLKEYGTAYAAVLNKALKDSGASAAKSPSGKTGLHVKIDDNGTISAAYSSDTIKHEYSEEEYDWVPDDVNLEHYGKLGMKWGKRHLGWGGGNATSADKAFGGPNLSRAAGHAIVNKVNASRAAKGKTAFPAHPDHTNVQVLRKRPPSTLSNHDLETLNKRLQLTRNYSSLSKKESKFDKGHTYVKEGLAVAATASAIYGFSQSPLGKEIRRGVTEAIKKASAA